MKAWRVGDVTVTRIEESHGPGFAPQALFTDWSEEAVSRHRHWLMPGYFDPSQNRLITSIHSWLVQTPAHTVLIDTCAGNHKERPFSPRFHQLDTPWLERLAEAGVSPEQVDFVLCTHLHVDHVGWNTRCIDGEWVPTFPHARYVFSRIEYEHWSPELNPSIVMQQPGKEQIYGDSVAPVVAAGKALIIDGVYALDDWLTLEPAPGHTPGHIVVKLRSGDSEAIFTGDIMHHPIQVYEKHWNSRFCDCPEEAGQTRSRVLEYCVDRNALLMPAHFAHPHTGHVSCPGGNFTFTFREPLTGLTNGRKER
jgi:glyoxylase-like metal-dependent hydrolase (beta-lactamase superfamily II)